MVKKLIRTAQLRSTLENVEYNEKAERKIIMFENDTRFHVEKSSFKTIPYAGEYAGIVSK